MVPSPESDKTDPATDPGSAPTSSPRRFSSTLGVDIAGLSDPGRERPNNEDHFMISRLGRFMKTVSSNLPPKLEPPYFEETFYGLIVADGVGGGTSGEVASQLAIRTLPQLAMSSPNWIFRLEDDRFVRELLHRLKERMGQIHSALIEEAKARPDLKGFGTTMTIALSVGNVLLLAHIGDSRVYLQREGRLRQLTRDHTLAQDLADRGFDTGHGVPVEKLKHVLTQALTDHARPLEPDVQAVDLEDGDRVLLCTDGLTDMIPDEAIAEVLGDAGSSEAMARRLVDRALEAGGRDNVTVVVASYQSPDSQ